LSRRLKQQEYRKENNYVISQRYLFLKEINEEMSMVPQAIYSSFPLYMFKTGKSSYIHQNRVSNFDLTIEDTPLKKLSDKGKRMIMVGGLTEDGWLGVNCLELLDLRRVN